LFKIIISYIFFYRFDIQMLKKIIKKNYFNIFLNKKQPNTTFLDILLTNINQGFHWVRRLQRLTSSSGV